MLDSPEIAQGLSSCICSESRYHCRVRPPPAVMSCVGVRVRVDAIAVRALPIAVRVLRIAGRSSPLPCASSPLPCASSPGRDELCGCVCESRCHYRVRPPHYRVCPPHYRVCPPHCRVRPPHCRASSPLPCASSPGRDELCGCGCAATAGRG